MKTLFLSCNDPCEAMKPPWHAYASFDYFTGRNVDIWIYTPAGWFPVSVEAHETGGDVFVRKIHVWIDCWENVFLNCLRLRKVICPLHACTLAECLFRMAPLLETAGSGEEVTECLINNL